MFKILTVFGTRPEVIKMAPIISELELNSNTFENHNCLTGQHKEMLEPLIKLFGLRIDYNLNLMRENQTLEYLTTSVVTEIGKILRNSHFDMLLVQGDTTTSMAAALAAFYAGIKIGHIEAGLRTFNKLEPYPEEANRRIIDSISDLFFVHSERAKSNLLNESISADKIVVAGNTVIDALVDVAARPFDLANSALADLPLANRKVILITAHRRENLGFPLASICEGLRRLALKYGDEILLVYPVHRNPRVGEPVRKILSGLDNVRLIDPLDYQPMVYLMKQAYIILTDSGGLQEEAPSLGKPVLVLRNVTERQEAVEAGVVKTIGTDALQIFTEASKLLDLPAAYNAMANTANPYGDGTARKIIVKRLVRDALLPNDHV